MEDLEKALLDIQYCDGKPMLRKCMICKDFLGEPSRLIAQEIVHGRSKLEAVFSHGAHDKCIYDYYDGTIYKASVKKIDD